MGGLADATAKRSLRTTVRTLPEQIADDLGAAIARGERAGGERLLEQEIASAYGVSRGPVREALRLLAQRGLAVVYPRRGAYVIELGLDSLADLFNTRAVLMGLAARYFAAVASEAARENLAAAVDHLRDVGYEPDVDPESFIRATSRIGLVITRNCGSESLGRLIEHQNANSLWGTLWHAARIDFLTPQRRFTGVEDYVELTAAIDARDDARAEAVMRRMIMNSLKSAIEALAEARGQSYDARRLLSV